MSTEHGRTGSPPESADPGTCGIYTLANDQVFDQLVALLNSIDANVGRRVPVHVIPYDDRRDRVGREIDLRENVFWFDNEQVLERWRTFSEAAWAAHPSALSSWRRKYGRPGVHRIECNRRFAAFDSQAPLERFVYLDADTLLFGPLSRFFRPLDRFDVIAYDFQHKHPQHVFNILSDDLASLLGDARWRGKIFCSGCFASKRGLFPEPVLDRVVSSLELGGAEALYLNAPNQSLLNYMVLRAGLSFANLAFTLPREKVTGNAVTSPHFENIRNVLYDHGRPLTYLHYIGIPAAVFRDCSNGGRSDFRYRDVFMHYRFLEREARRCTEVS